MRNSAACAVFYLTQAEQDQILSYIHARDQHEGAGWYYGHKRAFERRHKRLLELFGDAPSSQKTNLKEGT